MGYRRVRRRMWGLRIDRADRTIAVAPPPNGSILRIVDFPPVTPEVDKMDGSALRQAMGVDHAGSLRERPSRHAYMHRTKSVDYAIILAGEIDMLLDDFGASSQGWRHPDFSRRPTTPGSTGRTPFLQDRVHPDRCPRPAAQGANKQINRQYPLQQGITTCNSESSITSTVAPRALPNSMRAGSSSPKSTIAAASTLTISPPHATPLGMASSPGVFLAAVAQRTKRLRFGPLVYILSLSHPLRILEEICMLDQMSNGRLEVGVGRGASPYEIGYFGVDAQASPKIYTEAYQIILQGLQSREIISTARCSS